MMTLHNGALIRARACHVKNLPQASLFTSLQPSEDGALTRFSPALRLHLSRILV